MGFALDQPGQIVEELTSVRKDRVDLFMRSVDEHHLWWVGCLGERIDPRRLHQGDGLIRLAIDLETTDAQNAAVGRSPGGEISIRDSSVIVGRQHQQLAAFSLIYSGGADTHNFPLPEVTDTTQHHRGEDAAGVCLFVHDCTYSLRFVTMVLMNAGQPDLTRISIP